MKKSLLSLIVLLLLLSASVMAQTVTGRVTANAAPLPGVSILIKGTSNGTSTDADGKFSLNIPDKSAVLVVSFIGFSTQEIEVGDKTVIDVALQEDQTQLSEVVVTALGISRETKTLVYATQSVKPAELVEVRDANNVLNALQGKVANALITQGSGGPGSGARIVLRGNRSIQGSNNALAPIRRDANIPHPANALGMRRDLNHKKQKAVLRSPAKTSPTLYVASCALTDSLARACNWLASNARK